MTVEEIDQVAADFLDGEIVDLASDWLGNTVCDFHRYSREKRLNVLTFLGGAKVVRKMLFSSSNCNA